VVTPVALTDAIPLLETGGVTGRNSSQDIRKGWITPLVQVGSTSDEFVARQGVFYRGVGTPTMKVSQNGTADRNVRITAGSCVINRTGEGSYLVFTTTAVSTLQLDLSDATNPCIDAVVVRLYDKNITADSGAPLHGPYFDAIRGTPNASTNLNGTPGSAGGPPIIPDGCLLLAYVVRAASSPGNTIIDANITDKRKSTALLGANRLLLAGDSAADSGYTLGDLRQRLVGGVLQAPEFWGVDSKWHGTVPRYYQGVQTLSSGTRSMASNTVYVHSQIDIPDLGYDYAATFRTHIQVSGLGNDNYVEGWVRSDNSASGTIWAAGSAIARGALDAPLSLPGYKVCNVPAGAAKTFYFTVRANVSGSFSWTDLANGFSALVVPL